MNVFSVLVIVLALGPGCTILEPSDDHRLLQTATTRELTQLLSSRKHQLQTLKGLFSAQIQGPGVPIAQTVHGTINFQQPRLLRLKGFTRFGGSLFDFSLGQAHYRLALPQQTKVYSGNWDDLQRNEEIAKPILLTVLAMNGVVGIEEVGKDEFVGLTEDEDRYRLEVYTSRHDQQQGKTPTRRIWFDRKTLWVVREDRLGPAGGIEASLFLQDFREIPTPKIVGEDRSGMQKLFLPFNLVAQDGGGLGKIKVKFMELQTNVPIKVQDFPILHSFLQSTGTDHETSGH